MKRYNHIKTIATALTTALLLASCVKSDLVGEDAPSIPAGMGELTLGRLLLNNAQIPATEEQAPSPTTRAGAPTALPEGVTLRLYAFKKGETNFTTKLATRTYTTDAAGAPQLDSGQEPLYLPGGEVDIYLVGPVSHDFGTPGAPQIKEVAGQDGIHPRVGADLIAAYTALTVATGNVNPLPAMTLNHKMAMVQVVIEANPNAVYENLVVEKVQIYSQPTTGTFTLDNTGGVITPDGPTEEFVSPLIVKDPGAEKYTATTVLMPQPSGEFKIATTFNCNQKNEGVGETHPTLRYLQSALVTAPLAAGTATRFSTKPITPVEIKWRTEVVPWNDVLGDDLVMPGPDVSVAIPPTPDQYVEIDGLKWTKGNLVAKNTHQCMVGAPTDGGLYFQFGSLIGWKGGSEASGGTGVGANPNEGSGTQWWGGTGNPGANIFSTDAMVWPIGMAGTPSSWPRATTGTAHQWYLSGNGVTSGEMNVNDKTKGIGDPCAYYLGDPWRTPTAAEFKAVFDNANNETNWTSTTNWSQVTSPYNGAQYTGNALYFPASGNRYQLNGSFSSVNLYGYCWSSSVYNATSGYLLYFTGSSVTPQNNGNRSYGLPVRCVSGTYVEPITPDYTATPANSYATYPKTAGGAMQTVKFNALKKPVAKYQRGSSSVANATGSNPSTASTDGGLENDITYQEGDVIEVTWQTAVNHGTTGGAANMVIKSIVLGADGIATVEVNGAGNAVLSYKRGGVILWNYHIWATDSYPFATHAATGGDINGTTPNGQARFMDRNLGALAATAAKPATADAYKYFGVMYQHGRPTPFSGQGAGETASVYTKIFDGSGAEITGSIGGFTQSNAAVSTVTDAIKTPNTYYCFRNATAGNIWSWFSGDISLWSDYGANKSIYDPCPYGYRVPMNGSWAGFSVNPKWSNGAIDGGSIWSSIWWPAVGLRSCGNGALITVGSYAYYWSSTRASSYSYASYDLDFDYSGSVYSSDEYDRSYGFSVRCVEEGY